MLVRLCLLGILSLITASCNKDSSTSPQTAALASGQPTTGNYLPISGLHYETRRATTALTSGITDKAGRLLITPYADAATIFLDADGLISIASIPLTGSKTPYLLFEHLNINGFAPHNSDQKLVVLLAALDADPATPGVQIIERVRDAVSDQAADLITLLKSNNSASDLKTNPAVLALLAAFDDPTTPASEARTGNDIPSIDNARALLGLSPLDHDDSDDILRYPYETVYGDACRDSAEPTPGCTFSRQTGQRITVSADPDYDQFGFGSDDLWYVTFDSSGNANVYDHLGVFQYSANISNFAGYVGGTTIGVGTTGTFWENVSGGTYWLGDNGVLYSANTNSSNYGQAIN